MIGHVQLKKKLPKIKAGRFCQVNFLGSIFLRNSNYMYRNLFRLLRITFGFLRILNIILTWSWYMLSLVNCVDAQ